MITDRDRLRALAERLIVRWRARYAAPDVRRCADELEAVLVEARAEPPVRLTKEEIRDWRDCQAAIEADGDPDALPERGSDREAGREDVLRLLSDDLVADLRQELAASPVPVPEGRTACDSECNPYVAACGARFCTYEEMAQHKRTDHSSAAREEEHK